MWRGNCVWCQAVQRGWRLVLLVPGSGMEFPSTGRDQQPPARATGSQHPLLQQTKALFSSILIISFFFNESPMILTSSHRISARTGEQWFYMPGGSCCCSCGQQEPQVLQQQMQSCILLKKRYKCLSLFLAFTSGNCFCRCLYYHTV